MEGLVEIAVAFFAGGGFAALLKYLGRTRKSRISEVLQANSAIKAVLAEICDCSCAQRAIVVRLNNGGRPTIGCTLSASIVHEFHGDNEPIKHQFQNRVMDAHYNRIVVQAHATGGASVFDVASSGGPMRRVWEAMAITHVGMAIVAESRGELFHLAVHYSAPPDADCLARLDSASEALRSIFKKWL